MKIAKIVFSIVIFSHVCLTGGQLFAVTLYDDFSGNSIDTEKWVVYDTQGILSQSGGFLRANAPPNGDYALLKSKKVLKGDFEVTLYFENFIPVATVSPALHNISLQVSTATGFNPGTRLGDDFVFISYDGHPSTGQNNYFSEGWSGGAYNGPSSLISATQSALLRITRVDDTIRTYYNESGTWTLFSTYPAFFTDDVLIWVQASTGVVGDFSVSVDYLEYSSCAEPAPTIDSPAALSTVFTSTVPFQWTSNGQNFHIEIQKVDTTPVYTGTMYSSQVNNHQKIIPELPDGDYRWRVAPTQSGCTSFWSDWTTFTVAMTPPPNSVAFYPLNGDGNDYSGQAPDGILQGGVAATDGISGEALFFDGVDDQVSLIGGQYTGANFTYSMWVRPNQLDTAFVRTFFSVHNAFSIKYQGSHVQLRTPTVRKDILNILDENVWTHLVFSYSYSSTDGYGSIEVYKNGSLFTTVTGITIDTSTHEATIGADISPDPPIVYAESVVEATSGNDPMQGTMDDLRLHDTTLNATAVFDLYDEKVTNTNFSDKAKAIIVSDVRDTAGNWLWERIKNITDKAYNVLLWQGYTKENIYYLNTVNYDVDGNGDSDDVDADATVVNLQDAITNWAKADAESLVLFLAGHGDRTTFQVQYDVDAQVMNATDLAIWLNELQSVMPGRLIVVYEACFAGAFIDTLKSALGPNRIVFTSSGANEKSSLQGNGVLSFSYQFWSEVKEGGNLFSAFTKGSDMKPGQNAWYDTDSDGLPKTPGDLSSFPNIILGPGFISAHHQPIIVDATPSQTLDKKSSSPLWATVDSFNLVANTWAMIVPSGYDPTLPDSPHITLPVETLSYSSANGQYEGQHNGFSRPGTYKVSFYAMDESGGISAPRTVLIEKNNNFPWTMFLPSIISAGQGE